MSAPAPGKLDMGRALSRVFVAIRRRPVSILLVLLIFGCLPQAAYDLSLRWMIRPTRIDASYWVYLLETTGINLGVECLRGPGAVAMAIIVTRAWGIETRDTASPAIVALRLALPTLLLEVVRQLTITIATVALIVPGIMLAVLWYVAIPSLVFEHANIFAALARSRVLTRGNRWGVFGVAFVIGALTIIVSMAVTWAEKSLDDILDPNAMLAVQAVTLGLTPLLFMIAPSAVYWELKHAREGAAVAEVADVFG